MAGLHETWIPTESGGKTTGATNGGATTAPAAGIPAPAIPAVEVKVGKGGRGVLLDINGARRCANPWLDS